MDEMLHVCLFPKLCQILLDGKASVRDPGRLLTEEAEARWEGQGGEPREL